MAMHGPWIRSTLCCVLAALFTPAGRASCSGVLVGGNNITVAQAVGDARIAYIGEVIGLKLLTRRPRHNTFARYEVTFRSITTLKGRSPDVQKGTYRGMYWEGQPPSSKDDDVSIVEMTGSLNYEFGKKYLLLIQKPGPLGEIGLCDNRVVGLGPGILSALRALPGIGPLVLESPPHDE
jgi:hypothetical protein